MLRMRSSLVSLLFFISFTQLQADEHYTKSFKSTVESVIENTSDFLIMEWIGYENLMPEHELIFRESAKKQGLERKLILRRLSEVGLLFGRRNAFTLDLGAVVFILVDEDSFSMLDEDEKRFLAGHEIAHAVNRHVMKKVGALMATGALATSVQRFIDRSVPFVFASEKTSIQKNYKIFNKDISTFSVKESVRELTCGIFAAALVRSFLNSLVSCYCEHDADVASVRSCGTSRGAEKLFDRFASLTYMQSKFFVYRLGIGIIKLMHRLAPSHPPYKNRIDLCKRAEAEPSEPAWKLMKRRYIDPAREKIGSMCKVRI